MINLTQTFMGEFLARPQNDIIGQVCLFTYDYVPVGWVEADGRFLSAKDYPELYQLIGNTFGGNEDMFNVPNIKNATMDQGAYYVCVKGVNKNNIEQYKGTLSEIVLFIDQTVPDDFFTLADGRTLKVADNKELYSIFGNSYGGNWIQFNLPNLINENPMIHVSYYVCTEGVFPEEDYSEIKNTLYVGAIHLYDRNAHSLDSTGLADGRTLDVKENNTLFALYGYRFGGDGSTTFALPNLENRTPDKGFLYIVQLVGQFPPRV